MPAADAPPSLLPQPPGSEALCLINPYPVTSIVSTKHVSSPACLQQTDTVLQQIARPPLIGHQARVPLQAVQAVEDALATGTRSIEALGQPLVDRMVAQLASKCCEALQQLRGISMTYRMTAKPVPTRCDLQVPGAGEALDWA